VDDLPSSERFVHVGAGVAMDHVQNLGPTWEYLKAEPPFVDCNVDGGGGTVPLGCGVVVFEVGPCWVGSSTAHVFCAYESSLVDVGLPSYVSFDFGLCGL